MRFLDADRSHETSDVVGEQFGRPGPGRLVGQARSARIERNAGEMLFVVGDLEGVAGVVCGEIGDEDQRLARPLALIVHRDAVDLDLGHGRPPGAAPALLFAKASAQTLSSSLRQGQCAAPPAFVQAAMPPSMWRAEARPCSWAACTAIAERSPKAQ